ncbi:MAG: 50S ribosomal protein L29 [Gemmatimonadetes bacterium]|nr:50S ribosomal protein L29 [Gemmatimonadota bacterium]
MKAAELRERTRQELEERLAELQEELFNLRFQMAAHSQLEDPHAIRRARREIARIHTLLREDDRGERALPNAES